jgi:Big-like domain-containing protein
MTEVPLNAVVQVTFSEQINPLTVTGTTLQVLDNTTFTLVEGSVVVAADRRSATLTPRAALAPLTLYTIQAFGITDLAGQAIPGLSTSFTTGVQ